MLGGAGFVTANCGNKIWVAHDLLPQIAVTKF
jgi:hypothetical protein